MGNSVEGAEADDPKGSMDHLQHMLAQANPIMSVLCNVVEMANHAIAGACETSVTLISGGDPACVVHTGELALHLEQVQYEHGSGPCLEAARGNEIVEVADCHVEERWPHFTEAAIERGALSCLAVPIPVLQQGAAALTIYAEDRHAFTDRITSLAVRYGAYAAAALAYLYAEQSLSASYADRVPWRGVARPRVALRWC